MPALFIFTSFYSLAEQTSAPHQSNLWSLLLHTHNGQAQITDPKFLLSANNFSLKEELDKTLEMLTADPYKTFCRFPARATYLADKFQLKLPADRFSQCPELKEFIDHVPFDNIELVYASEVTSSATSMLGHIFIKVSGNNKKGTAVSHSLAYFTEITTLNPIKLIVDSTITGMPGFFSVRPFPTDLIQYRDTEQRNLWQFKLATSTESSKLFQLHIWELHQIELTYYFQSFNCATLTLEMLAILNPEVLKSRGSIVSPIDVVKAATTHNMVQTTTVDAAKHWLFYAISDTISRDVKDQLDQISSPEQAKAAAEALKHPFALRYLTMRLEQSVKHNDFAAAQSKATLGYLSAKEEQTIDLSRYKHPAKTPQDGGIGFTVTNDPNGSAVLLNFLPAGHFLQGDNRQYLTESELQIAKVSLELDYEKTALRLREFTVYSAMSLAPDSTTFPVWSGEFYMGFRPAWTADMKRWSTGDVSGAVGKSYKLHQDVLGYGLLGAGISTNLFDTRGFIYTKAGLVFTLAAQTKLQLQYLAHSGAGKGRSQFQESSMQFSWFPSQDQAVGLSIKHIQLPELEAEVVGLDYYSFF